MLAKKAGQEVTLTSVRNEFITPYNRLNLIIPQKQINKLTTGQFAYIKDDGSGTINDCEPWSATADQFFNSDLCPHKEFVSESIFERYLREVARLKAK